VRQLRETVRGSAVSGFADAMRRAGWGRDEAGDRRRRDKLSTTAALGLHPVPPEVLIAIQADLSRRAERIRAEAKRLGADPLVEHRPVPGHQLTYRTGKTGTEVTCECGRWDGWFNGPRSRRRVLDGHAAHAAAELSATGPIIVESVRADRPEELE
jgi:hypothetical protein